MDDLVRAVAKWLHGWDLGHSQQPYPEDYAEDAAALVDAAEAVPRSEVERYRKALEQIGEHRASCCTTSDVMAQIAREALSLPAGLDNADD